MSKKNGRVLTAVSRVVTRKWQTVEEIQRQIRAPKGVVARKLYYGAEKGLFEREKIIRFKLKSKKK